MSAKIPIVFFSLVVMTGIYHAATGVRLPKIPSDFCDAPISEQTEGWSFGGSSGRIKGKLEAIQIPIPETPQRPEKPKAESGLGAGSKPFIEAALYRAAIAGGTPQGTRENVESFFEKFGLRILKYQDEDACGEVRLDFRKPNGLADTVRLSAVKRKVLNDIKGLEEVKDVYQDGSCYRVVFAADLYPVRIREIFSGYQDLTVVFPRKNETGAGGVRTQLSAENIDDIQAVAARLKKQFPSTVASAEVKTEFSVMRPSDK